MSSVSPRRAIFAKLSPRLAGGDAEGRGGSEITIATAPGYLVAQSQTPLSLCDISSASGGDAGTGLSQGSPYADTLEDPGP